MRDPGTSTIFQHKFGLQFHSVRFTVFHCQMGIAGPNGAIFRLSYRPDKHQQEYLGLNHATARELLSGWIVRRFSGDRNVMNMAFLKAGIGDPDKFGPFAQIFQCR